MRPQHSYLICATPRTGSTLLCELLAETGMMGNPKEYFEFRSATGLPTQPSEYFTYPNRSGQDPKSVLEQLGNPRICVDLERLKESSGDSYHAYVSRVCANSVTPNGVFGAKMMWGYLTDFLACTTGDPDVSSSKRVVSSLQGTFPNLKFIFVTRHDKVRQAVSLWKAIQTQRWRQDVNETCVAPKWRTPLFLLAGIDYLRHEMEDHDNAWRSLFKETGVAPLILSYEEFSADLDATLVRVSAHLGLSVGSARRPFVPRMRKQSDKNSEAWLPLYKQLSVTQQL